jgi:hypothetical protein
VFSEYERSNCDNGYYNIAARTIPTEVRSMPSSMLVFMCDFDVADVCFDCGYVSLHACYRSC